MNKTLPQTGFYNSQAYLNGADNLTNNGASFYGSGSFYGTGSAATLTEGGGPSGTVYSGTISDGTATSSGQANTTAVVHNGGFVTFTGNNTYTGGTTINAGGIAPGNDAAFGTGTILLNGGTIGVEAGGLSIANAIQVGPNGGTIDLQSTTFSGAKSDGTAPGTLTLTQTTAPGSLVFYYFSGSNTRTGATIIDPGVAVQAETANATGTGPLAVNGSIQAQSTLTTSNLTGSGTVVAAGQDGEGGAVPATVNVASGNFTGTLLNNTVDETLLLVKTSDGTAAGGTLVLSGSNAYFGTTTVAAGTLKTGSTEGFSANSSFTVASGGTLDLAGFSSLIGSLAGAGAVTNSGTAAATLSTGNDNTSTTFSGSLADGAAALGLTKVGTGTMTLSGTSSYSGDTSVSAGTLQASSTTGLSPNSAFTVASGATLDINAFDSTVGSLAGAGAVINSGEGAATLTAGGNNSSTTFSGTLTDGGAPLALTKVGTGAMTLTAANTYSGGTSLNAGTLAVGNNNALGTGALTFNGGALQAAADGLTLTNTATLASDGTIDTQGNTLTYAGAISGTGALTKIGAGTLNLSAVNSYTGLTTVSGGTLQVATGAAVTSPLSNAGTVNNAGSWTGAVNANTGLVNNGSGGTWTGAVATNAGVVGNSGAWSGDVQANTGSIGNNGRWTGNVVSNAGTIGSIGLWTGNVQANAGAIGNGGTWAGSITNSAGGTVTQAGTITGGVTNVGTFNMIGGATASEGEGATTATINGPIGNSGTFNVTGPTTVSASTFYPVVPASVASSYTSNGISRANGGFDNIGALNIAAGGSFTVAGLLNNETAGQVTNAGTLALSSQAMQNAGTFSTVAGSTFSGGLTSTGTVNAAGGAINGAITNAGAFTVSGTVTSDAGFENKNTLTITGSGNYDIAGNLQNDSGAQVNVAMGGTLTDDLINAGLVSNAGTYNANVTNNSGGQITNIGTWNGALTNNAGATVTNSGTWNGDVNNAGSITNSGLFNSVNFTNTGTLVSTGGGKVTASSTLTNGGTIDLSQSTVGNALSGNAYVGNPGSRIIVGVDLRSQSVSATGGQATLVTFNSASGTTDLVFKNLGTQAAIAYYPTIQVVKIQSGNGNGVFVADPNSLAALSNGLISYSFAGGALNGTLAAKLNTAGAVAAGVQTTTALTTLNSNFFQDWQPFERQAFITGQQDAPANSLAGGPWIRGKYGNETDDAIVTAAGVGSKARVSTEFSGFQVGGDIGVFNIDKSGWNFITGITGGEFFATSNEKLGATTRGVFEIPFVGAYAALTRGPFFVDVMYHHDFYGLKLSDAPSGLSNQGLSGNGDSVHIESAYNIALGNYGAFGNLFVSPQGSLVISKVSLDTLPFTTLNLGKVKFSDIDSVLGRVGFRFGSNFQTETLALQPFVQASVWHEFDGNSLSEFDATSGVVVPMSVSRVGTFGQFGLGLNGELLGKNLLGTIRGDFRIGDNTSGESVTGQLRYQF